MQKQPVDRLLLESLVPNASLESLAKGYILNYKIEGKESNTIAGDKRSCSVTSYGTATKMNSLKSKDLLPSTSDSFSGISRLKRTDGIALTQPPRDLLHPQR
jgi:hypothetical protein